MTISSTGATSLLYGFHGPSRRLGVTVHVCYLYVVTMSSVQYLYILRFYYIRNYMLSYLLSVVSCHRAITKMYNCSCSEIGAWPAFLRSVLVKCTLHVPLSLVPGAILLQFFCHIHHITCYWIVHYITVSCHCILLLYMCSQCTLQLISPPGVFCNLRCGWCSPRSGWCFSPLS